MISSESDIEGILGSFDTSPPNSITDDSDIEILDANPLKSRRSDETQNPIDDGSDSDSECPTDSEEVVIEEPEPAKRAPYIAISQGGSQMIQRSSGVRTVGAIYPSVGPKSTQKVKRKAFPRTLTNIPSLGLPTEGDKYPRGEFACYLRDNFITFSRSDSKAPPEPKRTIYNSLKPSEAILLDGNVDFYYKLPADSKQVLWWKKKIGTWLARNVLRLDDAVARRRRYYITDFPDNYVLYQHRKGQKDDPRTDCYLDSSGRAPRFRSPAEFVEHAAWLIRKRDPETLERMNCACKYCTKRRKTLRKKRGLKQI